MEAKRLISLKPVSEKKR